jgi:GT2 family glycosyltransferase
MKVIVSVIVYNRLNNLQRWIDCWKQCETENAELIIIHNDNGESTKFKAICDEAGIRYIRRSNIGYDIGAFQDVCRERLKGFLNEWDYILWLTDDTLPMSKDFIKPFIEKQTEGVGITCMKISPSQGPHVRTTGFCISKKISRKLQFPDEPVRTKWNCYQFEHKAGMATLTNQVRIMGLDCVQVAPDDISPLWDSGYWKRLNRQQEHEDLFGVIGKNQKVVFIATIFNSYPQIISSLVCQTYENWELLLIHDGPNNNGLKTYIGNDERIKFIETKERIGNWGHGLRKWALEELENYTDADYVVITNADNYYTPRFVEYLLRGFDQSHTAVATYCSETVHSYKSWQVLPAKLERGFLDCGAVMIKKNIACEVGWADTESHSADWTFFQDIAHKYSWKNFIKVKGALFVHN